MNDVTWVTVIASFLGAGVGGLIAYVSALRATDQREAQARREEWGRRFTLALSDLGDSAARRRQLGRVLLVQLAHSSLASAEEKALADDVLAAEATGLTNISSVLSSTGPAPQDIVVEGSAADGAGSLPPRSGRPGAVTVTRDQVLSARALLELRAGSGAADPLIEQIARANTTP